MNQKPAKRIPIVSVKLVQESSLLYRPRTISSSEHLFELVRQFIGDKDREHLLIIGVNVKNEPTLINIAHIGSLTQSVAHVREIMKPLILSSAARFFAAHNHPSGNISPSSNDLAFTTRLKEAGELIGIELLDHLIVTNADYYYSMKEENDM